MKKLVILIAILLTIGCGNSSVKLDINSEEVQSLHEMATPSDDATVLGYLYENSHSFANHYILSTAISNYIKEQEEFVEIIPEEIVEEYVYKIFGNNIDFQHEKTYILLNNYCGFDYNKQTHQYELLSGCGGNMNAKFYRKITDATKEDDKIIILEKSIYAYHDWDQVSSHITIYNNIINKDIIKTYDMNPEESMNINIDDYLDEASTYQYVFKKVDDRYIFESFSLL